MQLNTIQKKILYELSVDARQSYKKISQKIKSKKDITAYHIKNLENKEIITKYVPVFSLSKLNIYSSKIYLKLHGLSNKDEKKLIQTLMNDSNIVWVAKCVGAWDLMIAMYSKDIIDFSTKKNKILSEFSEFIADYDITQIEDALVFHRDYLLETPIKYRGEFVFGGDTKKVELKDDEKQIIQLIKNNGRFEYHEIANKLNVDGRTIQNKIKNLRKLGVLQGYTCFIDIKKLGFQFHKLCIYLKNHKQENIDNLVSYLKQNPNTIHLIKSLGSWELEIEIETDNLNDIYDYINLLKNQFPEMIKKIDLVTITDELKLDFFPENY